MIPVQVLTQTYPALSTTAAQIVVSFQQSDFYFYNDRIILELVLFLGKKNI